MTGARADLIANEWSPHSTFSNISRICVVLPSDTWFRPSPVTYSTLSARPTPSAPWSHREDSLPHEPSFAYVCLRWSRNPDGWNDRQKNGFEQATYFISVKNDAYQECRKYEPTITACRCGISDRAGAGCSSFSVDTPNVSLKITLLIDKNPLFYALIGFTLWPDRSYRKQEYITDMTLVRKDRIRSLHSVGWSMKSIQNL